MQRTLLTLFALVFFTTCFSQIDFEEGYFIDNLGNKVNCLIKNLDWKNNPTEFTYKLGPDAEIQRHTLRTATEFAILNGAKYKKYDVNIDVSSDFIDNLGFDKQPSFEREVLYLKVLVESNSTLLSYESRNLKRFFYTTSNEEGLATQLVYKRYKSPNGRIATNNRYQQQLFLNFKCDNFSSSTYENVGYRKSDLVRFFERYNECSGAVSTNLEDNKNKDLINLTLKVGARNSSLNVDNSTSNERDIDFGSGTGFRFGLEFEYVLPFNKNKWALFLEPTINTGFSSDAERIINLNDGSQRVTDLSIDYSPIDVPIGIRHYMFLNDQSKIFLNAAVVFSFDGDALIVREVGEDLEVNAKPNFALGIGYKFDDKFMLELRYDGNRDLLNDFPTWSTDYTLVSINLGYSIF